MSAGARQTIGVNAPVGGLEIASRDVNGDNIIDLVVSTAWLKSPVAVLVNDGHGNFTIRDPAAFSSALINPSQTLDSPSKQNPDEALAISSRSSDDFVATERATQVLAQGGVTGSGQDVVQTAFGREWASPEQIADVVAFMASGRASYVSGTVVNVDLGASRA